MKNICNICGHDCVANKPPRGDFRLDTGKIYVSKYESNPILPFYRNAFGSLVRDEGNIFLYWCDFKNVYRSWSPLNEISSYIWSHGNSPIMCSGKEWDYHIDCASVFKEDEMWYMLYRGGDRCGNYAVGLAYSEDGYRWEKHSDNPVLFPTLGEWDGIRGRPCKIFDPWGIMKVKDTYYLWYNSEHPDKCRCTGLATSKDMIHWKKDKNNPIFENGRYCVSPFVFDDFGKISYWMIVPSGGFLRDGSIQFELYQCKNPKFYPEDRRFISYIMGCGSKGAFDSLYIDTPSMLTNTIQRKYYAEFDVWALMAYTGEGPVKTFWRHGLAIFNLTYLRDKV